MNDYGYDSGLSVAAILIGTLVWLIFALGFYILASIFLMKIFDKAGVQGRWRAWVPIYNGMVFLKLADLNPWLVLIAMGASIVLGWIPVIGQILIIATAVLWVLAAWRVGLKLQKGAGWVVLYIFLSIVWYGINAFDKSVWNPNIAPAPWAGNSFFADRTVWQGIPTQPSAAGQAGYGAPQGYQAPAAQGYAPPAAPQQPGYGQAPQGYQPPAAPQAPQQGFQPPAAPPASAPSAPAAPPAPPATPPAPPAPPSAAPGAPAPENGEPRPE